MNKDIRHFKVCNATEKLQYYCEGPKYDQFAERFENLLLNKTLHDKGQVANFLTPASKSRCWGKRQFPFPANKTILVLGNSHTRQVLLNIQCQYPTLQFFEPEFNESNETTSTSKRRGTYYFMEFLNHAKVHLVTNHALFYSRQWRRYLEAKLRMNMQSFDQLIVGRMNTYKDSYNTSFMALMLEKTAEFDEADFTKVSPPTLYEIAREYKGPIVAHSMMADYGNNVLNREMTRLVKRVNRKNIRFVNGRTYIPVLGECSSDHWDLVDDCLSKPKGHRCIGHRGGHPDLVAWDIIEAAHNYRYDNSCRIPQGGKHA